MHSALEHGRDEIFGCDAELAALTALLVSRGSEPAALVVTAAAGMGKTTLVRAALVRAEELGLRVLAARPALGEAELPYVGLGDLLAPLVPGALASLAAPQRAAVAAALAREGSVTTVDPHALSRGLLELLRAEATEGDLLVVVDDVQWLDRPTHDALTFALRRIERVPIRLLVSMRVDAEEAAPPLGLEDWTDVQTLAIAPMGPTDLGALVRQRLGVQLSRPRLELLERQTGGNPMFALELVRAATMGTPAQQPTTLVQSLQRRVAVLDPETRETVRAAAAALQPTPDLLLRAGCSRAGIEGAIAAGILQLNGERLAFTHPLLASAAYDSLLSDDRRRIHHRLGEASADGVERGHHAARAAQPPDPAAAATLDKSADEAAALGDHAGAAAFLRRADELAPGSVDRELRAATELLLGGDVPAAASLSASLVDRLPPGRDRAAARLHLVNSSTGSTMSYDDGLAELAAALADAAGDDAMEAELYLDRAAIMLGTCNLEAALADARRAADLAERTQLTPLLVEALAGIGMAESMLGFGVTSAARRAVDLWDGVSFTEMPPRMTMACVCIPALQFAEAERLLEEEVAFAQERGFEPLEVIARGHLAHAQLRAGRWPDALRNANRSHEHARQASEPQVVAGTAYALAMTLASLGKHAEAHALASEALEVAEATNDFWFRISHRAVLGQIALTEGDARRAIEWLEPAWALMLERGLGDLSLFPVAHTLTEALVAVGRVDETLAIAGALRDCRAGGSAWCRAMTARCEGLAASARGEQATARAAFAAALEAHAELPEPFEHARTLLLLGRAERRARSWGAARIALTGAHDRFEALGAVRWTELAAADLARLPGRRPADGQGLSVREREIAEFVASGLANREIAARLHLSISTVETNLSRTYSKLGIRSRTELAALLTSRESA